MSRIGKKSRRAEKAMSFGLCLVLSTSALTHSALAGTWFSESRFAYFGGDVYFWGTERTEGFLAAGPVDAIIGGDPFIQLYVLGWTCYMTEFSNVQINYEGKDYYAVGLWEIQKGTIVRTNDSSTLVPYMAGLGITKVAIITWDADVSDIRNVLIDQLNITDLTVICFTEQNCTGFSLGKRADPVTGKYRPGYYLSVDNVTISDEGTLATTYFDSVIFADCIGIVLPPQEQENRIEADLPSATSYVSGDLYVTGNWTHFHADMENIGTFSGKVDAGNVKYGSVEFSWTPSTQHTFIIDGDPDPRADLNDDHRVDIIDLFVVARAFGATEGSALYDALADINSDSVINILDITIVAQSFGTIV